LSGGGTLPLLKSSSAWLLLSRCQLLIYLLSTNNLRELGVRHTGVKGQR
jgi:hypothetical protein